MDFKKIDFRNLNYKNIIEGGIKATFFKPSERTNAREAICRACPQRMDSDLDKIGQCALCGCKIHWKINVLTECCPSNKWLDVKRTNMLEGFSILNLDVVSFQLLYEQSEKTFYVFVKDFDLIFFFTMINNDKNKMLSITEVFPRDCSTDFRAGFLTSHSKKEFQVDKINENSEILFKAKYLDNVEQYRLKFLKAE